MFAIMSGGLGSGKTTAAVGMIRDYLAQGRKVATNIDLTFEKFKNTKLKVQAMRLSDVPTARDLESIGRGHDLDRPDEERNGLLILDEAALWLNSRSWNDAGRKEVIAWFVHARKRRWDVVILIQAEDALDGSVRKMFGEYSIRVMNMAKIAVPLIGWLGKMRQNGQPFRLPKIHRAVWFYNGAGSAIYHGADNYTGKDVYHMFDTEQGFGEGVEGPFSYLSPWHLKGRYEQKKEGVTWRKLIKALPRLPVVAVAELGVRLGLLQRWGSSYLPAPVKAPSSSSWDASVWKGASAMCKQIAKTGGERCTLPQRPDSLLHWRERGLTPGPSSMA